MFQKTKEEKEQATALLLNNLVDDKTLINDSYIVVTSELKSFNNQRLTLSLENPGISLLPKEISNSVLYVDNINNQTITTISKRTVDNMDKDEIEESIKNGMPLTAINIVHLREDNYLEQIKNLLSNRHEVFTFNFIMSQEFYKKLYKFSKDEFLTDDLSQLKNNDEYWNIIKKNLFKYELITKDSCVVYEEYISHKKANIQENNMNMIQNVKEYFQSIFNPVSLFKEINTNLNIGLYAGKDPLPFIVLGIQENKSFTLEKKLSFQRDMSLLAMDAPILKALKLKKDEIKRYYEENNKFVLNTLNKERVNNSVIFENLMLDTRVNAKSFINEIMASIKDKTLNEQEYYLENFFDIRLSLTVKAVEEQSTKATVLLETKRQLMCEDDFIAYFINFVKKNRDDSYGFFTNIARDLFGEQEIINSDSLKKMFPEIGIKDFSELLSIPKSEIKLKNYLYDFVTLNTILSESGKHCESASLISEFLKDIYDKYKIKTAISLEEKNIDDNKTDILEINLIGSNDYYLSEDFLKRAINLFQTVINESPALIDSSRENYYVYHNKKEIYIKDFVLREKLKASEDNTLKNSKDKSITRKKI